MLTPRETQCLSLVASGLNDRQMAGRLGISSRTVRFHIANVEVKLDARTRAHAVAIAMRGGLLDETQEAA